LPVQYGLSTEGEDVGDERGRTVTRTLDLGKTLGDIIRVGSIAPGQGGVAQEGLENVVKVVSDAARKPTYGLQLLGLLELNLQLRFMADIAKDQHMVDDRAAAVPNG